MSVTPATTVADALDMQADVLETQARTLRALAALARRRDGDEVLSVAEAAERIRRSTRYVRDAIGRGDLRATGRGRVIAIRRSDLDAWVSTWPARPVRDVSEASGVEATVTEQEIEQRLDELLAGAAE